MSQKYQQLLLQLEVARTEALKITKTSTKPIIAITTRTTKSKGTAIRCLLIITMKTSRIKPPIISLKMKKKPTEKQNYNKEEEIWKEKQH